MSRIIALVPASVVFWAVVVASRAIVRQCFASSEVVGMTILSPLPPNSQKGRSFRETGRRRALMSKSKWVVTFLRGFDSSSHRTADDRIDDGGKALARLPSAFLKRC